jgi:putative spermidine/putrescine transport system ATP-binding protein
MTPSGLELLGLRKSYGNHVVVNDVSLQVPAGQFVCFLGPSGCGKTTLLRMIAGLETPTGGRILLDGLDITATPAQQRNFAMVFQALALFPFLDVADNIAYSLRLRNVARQQRQKRVAELLDLIKLPDCGSRRIEQLSGGQRQRVAFARALAQEPMLFLLDEPLSALDAKLRDHMQIELRQLQQKLRLTTILVTHDQREAMTLADSIVVMADGAVQQIGSPSAIYRQPANRFVAGFIGQCNLLDAEVVDAHHLSVWGRTIEVPAIPDGLGKGASVTYSIRPEDIRILPGGTDALDTLPGRVSFAREVGERVELRVDCNGHEVIGAATPADWAALAGSPSVAIQLRPGAGTVLTC